jgi:hypothetical protein
MKKETSEQTTAKPLRCHCRSLLARIMPEGVELRGEKQNKMANRTIIYAIKNE